MHGLAASSLAGSIRGRAGQILDVYQVRRAQAGGGGGHEGGRGSEGRHVVSDAVSGKITEIFRYVNLA